MQARVYVCAIVFLVFSSFFLKEKKKNYVVLKSNLQTFEIWPCVICHLRFWMYILYVCVCVVYRVCMFNTFNIFFSFNLTTPLRELIFPFCYPHLEGDVWMCVGVAFRTIDCCRSIHFPRSMYSWWCSIRTLMNREEE